MRLKYRKDTKKCPRCDEKMLENQKICPDCGLVFAKLEQATNAEAKRQFFQKDKSIVMVKETPKDVNKRNLLLFSGFLGIFGAHNFYIGRYYKAIFMCLFGLLALVYVALPYSDVMLVIMSSPFVVIPTGLVGIFWVADFIAIVFEKYKIPVALRRDDWKQLLLDSVAG